MCPEREIKTSICGIGASLKVEYTFSWANGQVTIKFVADAGASVKRFFFHQQKFKRVVTNLVIKWPLCSGFRFNSGWNMCRGLLIIKHVTSTSLDKENSTNKKEVWWVIYNCGQNEIKFCGYSRQSAVVTLFQNRPVNICISWLCKKSTFIPLKQYHIIVMHRQPQVMHIVARASYVLKVSFEFATLKMLNHHYRHLHNNSYVRHRMTGSISLENPCKGKRVNSANILLNR